MSALALWVEGYAPPAVLPHLLQSKSVGGRSWLQPPMRSIGGYMGKDTQSLPKGEMHA